MVGRNVGEERLHAESGTNFQNPILNTTSKNRLVHSTAATCSPLSESQPCCTTS